MKTMINYGRVSTKGQASEGVSLDQQKAKGEAWGNANGYDDICRLHDDGKSGKELRRRPKAQKAISLACELRCPLVIYSLSRLCRSIKDACAISERLLASGASLVSLSEQIDLSSSTGRLIYHILSAVNQFQREATSETTTENLAHVRANGYKISPVPYGFAEDKNRPETRIKQGAERTYYPLIEVPAEQAVIREAKRLAAIMVRTEGSPYGPIRLSDIAESLNASGYRTRGQKPWERTQVSRILSGWRSKSKQAGT